MRTFTEAAAVTEAVKERLDSGIQQFEERVEQGRRAIARGRHAAEGRVEAAALQIRRHPLSAVAVGTAAGALLGCVLGFAYGRLARC